MEGGSAYLANDSRSRLTFSARSINIQLENKQLGDFFSRLTELHPNHLRQCADELWCGIDVQGQTFLVDNLAD